MSIEYTAVTYLHNARDEDVRAILDGGPSTGPYALYFTHDSREDLRDEIRQSLSAESGRGDAETVMQRIGIRNTPLLDAVALSEGEDTVFTLRGAQKTVWRQVKLAVERVRESEQAVFIVLGGAGSGKSAIGLELMHYFQRRGSTVKYASGSRAFNAAMKNHVGHRNRTFQEHFKYFNDFVEPLNPPLDLLICDEAHRIRAKSTFLFKKAGTDPQVDELIRTAKVAVFLLDENQGVRSNEVGTRELIEESARRHGIEPRIYQLQTEFRCGGSESYRKWVLDLLSISGDNPQLWSPDGLMHVEVAESPEDLEQVILSEHRAGASARMVAGFCWPWSKPRPDGTLEPDVRIGDWQRSWNANGDRRSYADGAPPSRLWGVDDKGVGQIGCVYTSQGLEWDWCGVIMGEDMVWRDDHWEYNRGELSEANSHEVKRVLKAGSVDGRVTRGTTQERFEACVRNAYHVLLTRASRATVLYSTDPETQEYLRAKVGPVEVLGLRPTWDLLPTEARAMRPNTLPGTRARISRKRRSEHGQLDLFDN